MTINDSSVISECSSLDMPLIDKRLCYYVLKDYGMYFDYTTV